MFALIHKEKKYIGNKKGDVYAIGDFAILKELKEGHTKIGTKDFIVLKASLKDYMDTIRKKAQVIGMKDASYIIARCGIRSGFRVVEGGIGSGSLTTALLYFTYPDGYVYTYELREEFANFAVNNVERLPHEHWELKIGDIRKDVRERDIDAFIVDIPEPWEAVDMAKKALKNSGCFSAYVPTYNQVEKTYKKLKLENFVDLEACEIIKRDMHIGELGTRPENIEIAHTGFMVFGRKVQGG